MDYIEGESLRAVVERVGTLAQDEVLQLVRPLLDGLWTVHKAGFLHRDIKPDNIFIRKDTGEPVLLDFGSARQALGQATDTLTVIVSHGYAPFEQYTSKGEHGPWSDIYAVGATLYRCIAGERPPSATDRVDAMIAGKADPLVLARIVAEGRYSPWLLDAIDVALSLQPRDRPQSVAEFLAFRSIEGGAGGASSLSPDTLLLQRSRAAANLGSTDVRQPATEANQGYPFGGVLTERDKAYLRFFAHLADSKGVVRMATLAAVDRNPFYAGSNKAADLGIVSRFQKARLVGLFRDGSGFTLTAEALALGKALLANDRRDESPRGVGQAPSALPTLLLQDPIPADGRGRSEFNPTAQRAFGALLAIVVWAAIILMLSVLFG
jgi:hypothetical protein